MKPSYRISRALRRLLDVRAYTVIPLLSAVQRAGIAASSGTRREERLAAFEWWRGNGPEAVRHWRALEAKQPERAAWPLKIAQATKEDGDIDEAERVLFAARERGIGGEALELDLLRYARLSRRSNSATDDAEAIVADPGAPDAKVLFAAYHLITQNRLAGARTGLERVAANPKYRALSLGYLAATETLARAQADGRPQMPGRVSPALNSILVREPSSDTLVVGFALPEGTLGLPLNATHAMLSSAGVNGLYLHDSRNLYHLAGTDRFGPGYRAMIDGIRGIAAELGVKRLITVGGSATGYTALRTAMDLDADGALVFSPATLMLPTARPENARGAYTLVRLKQNVRPMMEDLRPRLAARKSPPRIAVYYSASNNRDIMHASNMVGVWGVELHPVEGLGRHDSLTEMAHRGYHDLLDAFAAK
jgi:hypothetical protein